jgi:hypothetical protein
MTEFKCLDDAYNESPIVRTPETKVSVAGDARHRPTEEMKMISTRTLRLINVYHSTLWQFGTIAILLARMRPKRANLVSAILFIFVAHTVAFVIFEILFVVATYIT